MRDDLQLVPAATAAGAMGTSTTDRSTRTASSTRSSSTARPGGAVIDLTTDPASLAPGGDLREATDEVLAQASRAGDEDALVVLVTRYRGFARAKARAYFLVGADREDIVQEGMIGLYKAIRDFDPTRETSFRAFAEVCVTRQILTAVKTATRQKHGPLNNYVSFSRPVVADDGAERTVVDLLPSRGSGGDPADVVVSAERLRALQAHVDQVLSDLEVEVLRLHVDGKSYAEIAALLCRQTKSIDNALQRIKRKLDGHLRAQRVAEAG